MQEGSSMMSWDIILRGREKKTNIGRTPYSKRDMSQKYTSDTDYRTQINEKIRHIFGACRLLALALP